MSWSIKFEEGKGEFILVHNQEPRMALHVPQMREADAMHLIVALEQAKAKPHVFKR